MNANFNAINNTATLSIPFATFFSDNNLINSDGNGNLLWAGGLGQTTYRFFFDATTDTTLLQQQNVAGVIHFRIGGTDVLTFDVNGPNFPSTHGVTLTTGSISRLSSFSAAGAGTFNHNNGGVPDNCTPTCNTNAGVGSSATGWDSATSTQVHLSTGNGLAMWCQAIAF